MARHACGPGIFPLKSTNPRQVWLECFDRVLEGADVKYGFPLEHMEGFKNFLKNFSAWMVNKV